jgi:hypothetical protein
MIGCITGAPGPILLIVSVLPTIVKKQKTCANQKEGTGADSYAGDGPNR